MPVAKKDKVHTLDAHKKGFRGLERFRGLEGLEGFKRFGGLGAGKRQAWTPIRSH